MSYSLSPQWTNGILFGYFHYQGNDPIGPVIIDEVRLFNLFRFYPIEGSGSPYLTAGAGMSGQFYAASGTITPHLYPDVLLGMGFEARLNAQEALFFESDYNLILAGTTLTQDVTAVLGLRCGF